MFDSYGNRVILLCAGIDYARDWGFHSLQKLQDLNA